MSTNVCVVSGWQYWIPMCVVPWCLLSEYYLIWPTNSWRIHANAFRCVYAVSDDLQSCWFLPRLLMTFLIKFAFCVPWNTNSCIFNLARLWGKFTTMQFVNTNACTVPMTQFNSCSRFKYPSHEWTCTVFILTMGFVCCLQLLTLAKFWPYKY